MKLNKRAVALLISLAILLVVAVGVTVAFVFAESDTVDNTFTPSRVACEVVDKTNHTYTVKNTGDTDAYIRVAVLVNLKNSDGNLVAQAPVFTVSMGTSGDSKWFLGEDGYYYFSDVVPPEADGASGQEVIPANLTVNVTSATGDYVLSVQVVASAIQATADAVAEWSNAVQVDGEVLAPK